MFEGVGTTVRVLDDIRITETSDGTEVTWKLELALRGPLGLFSPLVATAFRPAAASAIRGLQRYLDAHGSPAA
jgi:carbon monoxide dehydrogenase subunit G